MAGKLVPPQLDRLDEPYSEPAEAPSVRPNLRTAARRPEPKLASVLTPGFVAEAAVTPPPDPDDKSEGLTIEVPRRLKRALLAEVSGRRDDPERRAVASLKSVILEALAAHGFAEFIRDSDVEVQAGIFMKRQSAQLRRR
jgi:hypothetical protein